MADTEKLKEIVFIVVDELNKQILEFKQLEKVVDTGLFGLRGKLDYLELVNLVVTTCSPSKQSVPIELKC